MTRALLGLALAAAALALCALPWLIGGRTATALSALSETAAAHTGAAVQLLDSEQRRGWFATRQRVVLAIDDGLPAALLRALELAPADAPARVAVHLDVHHGPLPVSAPDGGAWPPALVHADVALFALHGGQARRLPITVTARRGVFEAAYRIDGALRTEDGKTAVTATAHIAPGTEPWIGRAAGRLTARVAAAATGSLSAREPALADALQTLLATGWLLQTDADYRSEVELEDGRLTANGREIPLPF